MWIRHLWSDWRIMLLSSRMEYQVDESIGNDMLSFDKTESLQPIVYGQKNLLF